MKKQDDDPGAGAGGGGDHSKDVVELGSKLASMSDTIKSFAEDVKKKMETGQTVTAELKEKVDKALTETHELREHIDGVKARALELEQKAARRGGPDDSVIEKSPGEQFIEHERVKEFVKEGWKQRGRVRIDLKTITTSSFTDRTVAPQRVPGIIELPQRRFTVRDLITPGRTSQNAVEYVRQTGFTNLAAVVAEGATKPESTLVLTLVSASVRTIAHWMLASKQILEDLPALQSQIDGNLRYGLALVEEEELLEGDGTGEHLHGIIPQASDYAPAFQPSAVQRIDTIRLGLLQAELALFPATGIVMAPTDWARIELIKDSDQRYIFTQPQNETNPRLWGRPVVSTPAMDNGEWLVGAFRLGAQIFDREDANVELSTEDSDNFRKNLVTIRAEERLALAVYRPEAFIHGEFGDAS